jgi:ABC-type nitrate/sulfonate/bicarbonate transport system substrate-binding protein
MPTRRQFLKASAAGIAGFPAIVKAARAADKITVLSPFGFTPEYSDLFNAYSGGYFAKQGLDAKVLATRGIQSVQQLVAGQADFIRNAAVDVVKGVSAQGLPLVCIATIGQGSTYHLVSLKDRPVATVKDLKGKKVGIITAQGGASSTYLEILLASAGLKKDDITMIVTGNNPGEVEYIKRGQIDCFMATIDTVGMLDHVGEPVTSWSTNDYFHMPGFVHVTRRDIVEKSPDLVQRYMRAIKASAGEMVDGSLQTVFERESQDFEMGGLKDMKLAIELQKMAIDRLWLAEGRKNFLRNVPARWKAGIDAMRAAGMEKIAGPETYYTNRFIDAA